MFLLASHLTRVVSHDNQKLLASSNISSPLQKTSETDIIDTKYYGYSAPGRMMSRLV